MGSLSLQTFFACLCYIFLFQPKSTCPDRYPDEQDKIPNTFMIPFSLRMILGTNDQNTCLEYEQVLPFLPNATLGKVFPKGEMK